MIDCKCSFSITLITEDFNCEKAQLVTRRAGPDIACSSEQGSKNCKQIYTDLKEVGLLAFDAEDDLLKTPASVFTKIQFAGLLGIQKEINNDESIAKKVDNIYQIVYKALQTSQDYKRVVDVMMSYKIKRKNRVKQ
ncbi:MAG: hypothetical protein AAF304_08630 [Pseudomonadota bacterium]